MTCGVAMALYNGERFIEQQLDTIRLQTQSANHVVLCDDGSTDHTVAIVQEYIKKHHLGDTWELHQNQHNLGYVKNFYKAISLCQTDLVFLSDQDDIWELEKIQKMSKIMEKQGDISLLCCKYGIIDENGQAQHSIVEPLGNQDHLCHPTHVDDIMRSYRWPGMIMCLRRSFFVSILPHIESCRTAHDLVFAILAADRNGFYNVNYIGAHHRRHGNNTAKEEHRVSKLLNRTRKLSDIADAKKTWTSLNEADLPLSPTAKEKIQLRLSLIHQREQAILHRSIKQLIQLYKHHKHILRLKSFICDIWLVCFGK